MGIKKIALMFLAALFVVISFVFEFVAYQFDSPVNKYAIAQADSGVTSGGYGVDTSQNATKKSTTTPATSSENPASNKKNLGWKKN